MKEPLVIKNDVTFKAVFARDTKECSEALKRLLRAMLGIEIQSLRYVNPINIQEAIDYKSTEFDIAIVVNTIDKIDMEIQLKSTPYFVNRLISYLTTMANASLKVGEQYDKLNKSMVICIVDFILFPEVEKYDCRFTMREEESSFELTDILEIKTYEMGKLVEGKPVKEMTEVEKWMYYFKYEGTEGAEELIKEIIEESEGVKMANEILNEVSQDERMRSIALSREIYQKTRNTELYCAKLEGKLEGKLETARNMLTKGYNILDIADITGLPIEEVRKLMN